MVCCVLFRWEAGPIPEDGVWAPWWYKSVHESTGFSSPKKYPRVSLWFVSVMVLNSV